MEEPVTHSSAPQPSKFPTWAIVLIVIVVLGCCCFGALGLLLAFGDSLLYELGLTLLLPLSALF